MTDVLYPTSYPTAWRTMEQNEARKTVAWLHPEFWRRVKAAMMFAAANGHQYGVGTGWRIQTAQPDGSAWPNMALPGNSNHEGFPADGVHGGAVAADMLGDLAWMEPHLKDFGLRSFVRPSTTGYTGKNEPWHIQPAEIPASRNRRKTPWALPQIVLPGDVPEPEPDEPIVEAPSPTLIEGVDNPNDVRWLQTIINQRGWATLTADGVFGPKTTAGVKAMQTVLGRTPDGEYGPKTAESLANWLKGHS